MKHQYIELHGTQLAFVPRQIQNSIMYTVTEQCSVRMQQDISIIPKIWL